MKYQYSLVSIGFAFTRSSQSDVTLHFARQLQGIDALTNTLPVPSLDVARMPQPEWQRQLKDAKASFDAEHRLRGHVSIRTWGMASSPLEDHLAVCFTLHPSDMIEYSINTDQSGLLCFSEADRAEPAGRSLSDILREFYMKGW